MTDKKVEYTETDKKIDSSLLASIFMIAFVGGVVAGMITSVIMIISIGTLIQDSTTQMQSMIEDMVSNATIECLEEPVMGYSKVILGEQTYYCLLSFVGERQENEIYNYNPVSGGD